MRRSNVNPPPQPPSPPPHPRHIFKCTHSRARPLPSRCSLCYIARVCLSRITMRGVGGGASGAGHCCHHRCNSPFAGFKQFYSSLLTGFGITDAGLSAVFGAEFYMAKSKLVCSASHKYKCCCELFKSCFIHRIKKPLLNNAHYIIFFLT